MRLSGVVLMIVLSASFLMAQEEPGNRIDPTNYKQWELIGFDYHLFVYKGERAVLRSEQYGRRVTIATPEQQNPRVEEHFVSVLYDPEGEPIGFEHLAMATTDEPELLFHNLYVKTDEGWEFVDDVLGWDKERKLALLKEKLHVEPVQERP